MKIIQSRQKLLAQIARGLGISDSGLSNWHRQFYEHGKQAFRGYSHQMPREEEIRQLNQVNDLLW